jgi:hypothetical protein
MQVQCRLQTRQVLSSATVLARLPLSTPACELSVNRPGGAVFPGVLYTLEAALVPSSRRRMALYTLATLVPLLREPRKSFYPSSLSYHAGKAMLQRLLLLDK